MERRACLATPAQIPDPQIHVQNGGYKPVRLGVNCYTQPEMTERRVLEPF